MKNRDINGFCSDYWKSYSEVIPSEKAYGIQSRNLYSGGI
ncbi:hypothetical protein CCAN11_2120009 [Capnocytophaga canimorsus]|uniref:Uncharacterized protein n=1 Tax=Capnocytophaga canimorsus TaxID=28188 RepID=A0A0B7IJW5_9FLAO|nr:hypothetical protein CCAN11_2120009 [Capnocytophaga canimorsus]